MKFVKLFEEYVEGQSIKKPTKLLKDFGKYRKFRNGTYETDLLPLFRHLNHKFTDLQLPEWIERVQQEDPVFYAKVQAGEIAQPDARELWRDLTGRPFSKFQHVLNPSRGVI